MKLVGGRAAELFSFRLENHFNMQGVDIINDITQITGISAV